MSFFRKLIPGVAGRYLGRLRFPTLFVLTLLLFAVNVVVPDPIPLVDEILLALGALMLGRLGDRSKEEDPGPQALRGRTGEEGG